MASTTGRPPKADRAAQGVRVPAKAPASPALCHFFKLGRCSKGSQCPFAHQEAGPSAAAPPPGTRPAAVRTAAASASLDGLLSAPFAGLALDAPPAKQELCIFAMTGKCRFGGFCRSVHGIQCPRCLKFCLHPDDLEQNEGHIQQCLEAPLAHSIECEEDRMIECGLCHEPVLLKADPRFGLLNCEHAFCIACIRSWRSKFSTEPNSTRSCPLCRVVTYFVVPSAAWVAEAEEKHGIIEMYKKKLSAIRCKHYASGLAACPFGTSCFYSHAGADGGPEQPALRTVVGENERVNVYRETRLSDFLVFKHK